MNETLRPCRNACSWGVDAIGEERGKEKRTCHVTNVTSVTRRDFYDIIFLRKI